MFGRILKLSREASGLSKGELARRIGVTPSFVHRVEAGFSGPMTQERILGVTMALGIDPDRLILASAEESRSFTIPFRSDPLATMVALAMIRLEGQELRQEIQRICESMPIEQSIYGYCPHCGAPGLSRERRPNGNDKCEAGHVYPSASALKKPKRNQ